VSDLAKRHSSPSVAQSDFERWQLYIFGARDDYKRGAKTHPVSDHYLEDRISAKNLIVSDSSSQVSHIYPKFGIFNQGKAAWKLISSLPKLEELVLLQLDDYVWTSTPVIPNLREMTIKSHFTVIEPALQDLSIMFPGLIHLRVPFSCCASRSGILPGYRTLSCSTLRHGTIAFGPYVPQLPVTAQCESQERTELPLPSSRNSESESYRQTDHPHFTSQEKQRIVFGDALETINLNIDYNVWFQRSGHLVRCSDVQARTCLTR
jgi:hypothetical protein